jgi:hypothetical protein
VPSIKHVGVPARCPACRLPKDQFARREAIWQHALAQFADQSAVDVSTLPMSDLVPMVRAWAQSNAIAQMDRVLFAEMVPPAAAPRFEPRSRRLAVALMLAILACLGIICSGVWRFLS